MVKMVGTKSEVSLRACVYCGWREAGVVGVELIIFNLERVSIAIPLIPRFYRQPSAWRWPHQQLPLTMSINTYWYKQKSLLANWRHMLIYSTGRKQQIRRLPVIILGKQQFYFFVFIFYNLKQLELHKNYISLMDYDNCNNNPHPATVSRPWRTTLITSVL